MGESFKTGVSVDFGMSHPQGLEMDVRFGSSAEKYLFAYELNAGFITPNFKFHS